MIENKLAGVLGIPISEASTGDNRKKLFSAAVGATTSPENHVAAMITTKNAELIEKQEKDKRANNIIIHGISEARTDGVALHKHDEDFIKSFLDAIEVEVQPKQIARLGNENANKRRPVKVILKNLDDKEKIISNLNKLKNAEPSIRGISVRDHYTQEERNLIRTMTEEAKRKNEAENVTHWKVRGTPKNGLKVVKITTRN